MVTHTHTRPHTTHRTPDTDDSRSHWYPQGGSRALAHRQPGSATRSALRCLDRCVLGSPQSLQAIILRVSSGSSRTPRGVLLGIPCCFPLSSFWWPPTGLSRGEGRALLGFCSPEVPGGPEVSCARPQLSAKSESDRPGLNSGWASECKQRKQHKQRKLNKQSSRAGLIWHWAWWPRGLVRAPSTLSQLGVGQAWPQSTLGKRMQAKQAIPTEQQSQLCKQGS